MMTMSSIRSSLIGFLIKGIVQIFGGGWWLACPPSTVPPVSFSKQGLCWPPSTAGKNYDWLCICTSIQSHFKKKPLNILLKTPRAVLSAGMVLNQVLLQTLAIHIVWMDYVLRPASVVESCVTGRRVHGHCDQTIFRIVRKFCRKS